MYAYTTGALGTLQDTITYTYGNTGWKDQLTNYDGTAISYDASGNPTNWIGNLNALTWNGRQLSSIAMPSNQRIDFKYNSDGIRTYKYFIDNDEMCLYQHDYMLEGSTIVGEKVYYFSYFNGVWTKYKYYYYDENGSPIGMGYEGKDYYFQKNILGDIEAIYQGSTKVVQYTYDAWGNVLSVTGTLASTVGQENPFRYRGYYYDTETGLYYLQSRYYDPQVGRFINADDALFIDATGTLLGCNLYAYSENNSIINIDPSGFAPFLGWGVQLEGSFMGITGGIEFVWFKSIAKSVYGNRNLPCVYGYGGFSYNFKGGNVWHIKSLIQYVKDSALRAFSSAKKAAWKIGGSLSLCAFLVYGTINHPQKYTGPFITTGGTLFHIKCYYSRSPKGDVYCWGLGISSSKFGFSPMSVSGYAMLPAKIVISVADWFSSLFSRIKAITNLI